MGLLSFFQRKDKAPAGKRKPPAVETADAVQVARTRARQRLIGAVVLLGIGIIGFPLLFDTQPRPISVDIPIEIPNKDAAAPLAMPAPHVAAAPSIEPKPMITESAEEADRDVAAPSAVPASEPVAASPRTSASSPPASAATNRRTAETKPESRPDAKAAAVDSARARALLNGKQPDAPAADNKLASDGRFIVQVGAFAEAGAARDARSKVEKLGLKTYTQLVDTASGSRTRVRVGPFASRDEAEKVSAKIKAAGLASAVLSL